MNEYDVKYRGLGRDTKGDDPLLQVRVQAVSPVAAIATARKARADIHYIVSVVKA